MGVGEDCDAGSRTPDHASRSLRLILEYDGTGFCGFQRQPGERTVQGEVERALASLCGEPVQVTGAGRTDAGVHACGQVIHFDTEGRIPTDRLERAANRLLAPEIRVRQVQETDPEFHARYSALSRTYDYWISREPSPPFLARYVLHEEGVRDGGVARMRRELESLLGRHDFRPFSSGLSEERNTVRTLLQASVEEFGSRVRVRLTADAFLRSMVRIVVGALLDVVRGRLEPWSLREAVESGKALRGVTTAPPHGLCLVRVDYPDGYPAGGSDDVLGWMLGR